jgi:hypothetical protein
MVRRRSTARVRAFTGETTPTTGNTRWGSVLHVREPPGAGQAPEEGERHAKYLWLQSERASAVELGRMEHGGRTQPVSPPVAMGTCSPSA